MLHCPHFDRTRETQSFLDGRLAPILKTSSSKPLVVSQSLSSLICGQRTREPWIVAYVPDTLAFTTLPHTGEDKDVPHIE